jgi:eukaryotic-like serine/threonine-protein kinase
MSPETSRRMDIPATLHTSLAGRYIIERELGRGGMATVYLARDLRHDRPVALKLLDPELGALLGAERFLSEIRVTANLQHPNLLPLFDSGEVDGLLYYVMPYVAGESLRARIAREKQLPVEEAVRLTTAVASALDYAHRHGIIHRDLKPENILLHEGQPLVADFGIALAVTRAAGERITQTGISLGTPHYMAPEQAAGDRVLDGRADIYSLASVCYELLTGEPPHHGATAQAVIARVLNEEPRPVRELRKTVPVHVDAAIERALAKVPADRFATAHEFAAALQGRAETYGLVATAARRAGSWTTMLPYALTAALGGVVLWQWASGRTPRAEGDRTVRFSLELDSTRLPGVARGMAFSPDGRDVAYIAVVSNGMGRVLLVRSLDDVRPRPVWQGGVQQLFFSPDGKWVGFVAGERVLKTAVTGSSPSDVARMDDQVFGASWAPSGVIVLGTMRGLMTVPAAAPTTSQPRRLTRVDTVRGERGHRWPLVLPDGNTIVFARYGPRGTLEEARLEVASLQTGESSALDVKGACPLGIVEGHLVFSNAAGEVMAVAFDSRSRRVTGDPVRVLEGLQPNAAGCVQAALSNEGSLVYQSASTRSQLVEVDARGTVRPVMSELRSYGNARYSPDGRRIAVPIRAETGPTTDISIYDIGSGTLRRLTTEGLTNDAPDWSADGQRVLFSTDRRGERELWWQPADGSGVAEPVVSARRDAVAGGELTPDGRAVVYHMGGLTTPGGGDIWWRRLQGDTTPQPLVVTRFAELNPRVSPNGQWIAYSSNESDDFGVYVRPFPGPGSRYVVSNRRAMAPAWSPDGNTVYYMTADGGINELVAARIRTTPDFAVLSRTTVVRGRFRVGPFSTQYDVAPDGIHFLMVEPVGRDAITIVHHWSAEMKARVAEAGRR